ICVFPGSHRLPVPAGQAVEPLMAEQAIQPAPIGGKRGRVVLRHPALVHKAEPVGPAAIRRTLLAQYCPVHVAPLYAERVATAVWPHGSHWFTTQHYAGIEPLD
ncbi:MAG TPA: hypothetical protein VFN42_08325, partial [Acetobacteraceae bacterium]|nr:hypothetical protein [Acetobacteraceae bacterium]